MWARHNAVPGKPSSPHQHRSGAEYGILHVLSGYYGGTYRGIPQGAIPAPPGVPYPNTPGVPIQGVLQTSTQGISSTLVYTLEDTPYHVNSTRRHHATVTFTQITPSSITLSSWTTRVPYVGTACHTALASYDSTG